MHSVKDSRRKTACIVGRRNVHCVKKTMCKATSWRGAGEKTHSVKTFVYISRVGEGEKSKWCKKQGVKGKKTTSWRGGQRRECTLYNKKKTPV